MSEPAASPAIQAAAETAYEMYRHLHPHRSAPWDQLATWERERFNRVIEAAAPVIAAQAAAADPTTETEGFRAWKAGCETGHAEERERIETMLAQEAVAELVDGNRQAADALKRVADLLRQDDQDDDERPMPDPDPVRVDWDRLQSLRNAGAIESDDFADWYAEQAADQDGSTT